MRFPPINPYIVLAIGVLAISSSAVLVKLASGTPSAIIAMYRLLFAVILMAPYVLIRHRNEFHLIKKRDYIFTAFAGLALAAHFIFWFESLNFTSVASSVVLVSLQPVFAFIGTYLFFKERFSAGAIISMLIALLGSVIIGFGDFQISGATLYGDILAVLGSIAITIYFLAGQQVRRRLSLMTYTFIVYGISTLILIFYNIVVQNPFSGFPINHWWIFLVLAIIPTFFGHSLLNWTLRWLSTSTISMGTVFEPIGASILAYFVLNESITSSQWLGGTIVLFGLFLFILSTSRKRNVTISYKNK